MKLIALATLLLAGCSAKLYHPNGNMAASVPWPQQATLRTNGDVVVEPGAGTVVAAQQFATGFYQNAPQLVLGTIQAVAANNNR